MKIFNKKARFNYEVYDHLETGIVLTGAEVKSIKTGHISLAESYVRILNGELFLLNANISPYPFADNKDYDPKRSRKLLAKKSEILNLIQKMQTKNLSLVALSIYTQKNKIKLEIALARGKKEFEKREELKKRSQKRQLQKLVKNLS